tara:strand:- start:327 stop:755 length:429 start_codon:yes stop_codon:yes gene_type:complete
MALGKIIHIDGPDKTGKDSIRRQVVLSSEGKALVYVRSFLSQIVYSRLYNRKIDEHWFFMQWVEADDRGELFYFIDCDFEKIKNRFIKHDEKDLDIKDWENHRKVFYDVIKIAIGHYGIKINRIDTTNDTVKQSAKYIEGEL